MMSYHYSPKPPLTSHSKSYMNASGMTGLSRNIHPLKLKTHPASYNLLQSPPISDSSIKYTGKWKGSQWETHYNEHFFMKDLDAKALITAPAQYKPTLVGDTQMTFRKLYWWDIQITLLSLPNRKKQKFIFCHGCKKFKTLRKYLLKKIKSGHTQQLTDHLNNTDTSGNIKVTHKAETNRTINFLDIKSHNKEYTVTV